MVLKMERAIEKDLDLVITLVNAAYEVEKGSTGLAFKASDRLPSHLRHVLQENFPFAAQVRLKGGCI